MGPSPLEQALGKLDATTQGFLVQLKSVNPKSPSPLSSSSLTSSERQEYLSRLFDCLETQFDSAAPKEVFALLRRILDWIARFELDSSADRTSSAEPSNVSPLVQRILRALKVSLALPFFAQTVAQLRYRTADRPADTAMSVSRCAMLFASNVPVLSLQCSEKSNRSPFDVRYVHLNDDLTETAADWVLDSRRLRLGDSGRSDGEQETSDSTSSPR